MSAREAAVAFIGWSHLLQAPATAWLATRVLRLQQEFEALPVLPRRVAKIMGAVSVFMPTALGLVVGSHPAQALEQGPLRVLALLLAGCLWTPRLAAQLIYLGPAFSWRHRVWHWALTAIFIVQGPVLLAVLTIPGGR